MNLHGRSKLITSKQNIQWSSLAGCKPSNKQRMYELAAGGIALTSYSCVAVAFWLVREMIKVAERVLALVKKTGAGASRLIGAASGPVNSLRIRGSRVRRNNQTLVCLPRLARPFISRPKPLLTLKLASGWKWSLARKRLHGCWNLPTLTWHSYQGPI